MSTPTLPIESRSPGDPRRQSDAVVFENVELAFERKVVLDDISFRLAHGETKAIFGVAGSGKSTILKLALGLLKPDAGSISVLGEDIVNMRESQLFDLRREVQIVEARDLGDDPPHHDRILLAAVEYAGAKARPDLRDRIGNVN